MDITIPEGMSDSAMLALIVGFVAPLVLNFIVNATWPAWAKSLTAFGFSAVAGVLTSLVTGAFEGLSIVSSILLILVVSITTYQNFWKQIAPNMQRGSQEKAEADERISIASQQAIARRVAEDVMDQHGLNGDQLSGGDSV